jgi:hypothetical protein
LFECFVAARNVLFCVSQARCSSGFRVWVSGFYENLNPKPFDLKGSLFRLVGYVSFHHRHGPKEPLLAGLLVQRERCYICVITVMNVLGCTRPCVTAINVATGDVRWRLAVMQCMKSRVKSRVAVCCPDTDTVPTDLLVLSCCERMISHGRCLCWCSMVVTSTFPCDIAREHEMFPCNRVHAA